MRKTLRVLFALTLALSAVAVLAACQQTTPAADEATEQVEENTDLKQAAADAVIREADGRVGATADAIGGLEAQIKDSQISQNLRQVQRELQRAFESKGDDRVAALRAAGSAMDAVITDIERAAEEAPEGTELKAKLTASATRLRETQAKLAGVIAAGGGATEATATP